MPDSLVVAEASVHTLPLAAPFDDPDVEVSGLTWAGDTLVLLPQYPSRTADDGTPRALLGLVRSDLERAVAAGTSDPLTPFSIPLDAEGLQDHAHPYQGCEAIVVAGNRVFVLVESDLRRGGMQGYLLHGTASPGWTSVWLDAASAVSLEAQTDLNNMAYETLTVWGDTLVALYEANGGNVNATPHALRFDPSLRPLGPLRFPTLEYRVTDATSVDAEGRFWVMNYFYPPERGKLNPAPDSLMLDSGVGASHRQTSVVERLVEYRITPSGIVRTPTPPIWLTLTGEDGRNWEGVARLGNGFLLATDRYPRTLLAYVEAPAPPPAPTASSARPH